MAYEEQLQSSWLSDDGELLNFTWNDTSLRREIKSGPIMEWDDAAWVLSATFIIFSMQTGTRYFNDNARENYPQDFHQPTKYAI